MEQNEHPNNPAPNTSDLSASTQEVAPAQQFTPVREVASAQQPTPVEGPASRRPSRKRRVKLLVFLAIAILLVAGFTGAALYVNDYYKADATAQEAQSDTGPYSADTTTVKTIDNMTAFIPEHPVAGLVFYPGGKVEAQAYAPLMQALATQGVLSVVCAMPLNLAVFDIDAAQRVQTAFLLDFPELSNWYIGGHSLGGSMAADFVSKHPDDYCGLVLLGSYSTADLSNLTLRVLTIYGSQDRILNLAAYEQNLTNLPAGSEEVILEGANHSQFGSYGYQAGDGQATITPQEQWDQTAEIIAEWVLQ